MIYKDLHTAWKKPNNANLTAKQFSFRLPVHIAAKLQALCDLYPDRNRTEIIADLLDHAMDELEAALPVESLSTEVFKDRHGKAVFHARGFRADFRERANFIYGIFQEEQGVTQSDPIYGPLLMTEAQFKALQADASGDGSCTAR